MKIGDLVCIEGSHEPGVVLKISNSKLFGDKERIVTVFWSAKNNTELAMYNSLKVVNK